MITTSNNNDAYPRAVQVNNKDEAQIVAQLLQAMRGLQGRSISPRVAWFRHRVPRRTGDKTMFVEIDGDVLDAIGINGQ